MNKTIDGERYLQISDLAEASGVNTRTLHRWLNRGDLVNFLTIYQSKSGKLYFLLGKPRDTDVLLPGETFKYRLPKEA